MSGDEVGWQLIRSFVSVVREGNLTRAARALGLTQPTLGRYVRAPEALAGEPLFLRKAHRLVPTEAAVAFFPRAREIETAVTALGRAMARPPDDARGAVRVTAGEILAVELLPALLSDVVAAHPGLEVELIASDEVRDLLRADADIAVRHVTPVQADLLTKTVGEIGVGLYASRAYLVARNRPEHLADLVGHHVVASDTGEEVRAFASGVGVALPPEVLRFRATSLLSRIAAVRAGAGIGPCHDWLAQRLPELERVLPDLEAARLPVHLVAHPDLRRSRRIRSVFDALDAALRRRFREPGQTAR